MMDRRRPIFSNKICPKKEFPFQLFQEELDLRTSILTVLIENFIFALMNGVFSAYVNYTSTVAKVIKTTISFAIYASFFTRESVSSTAKLRIAAFEEKRKEKRTILMKISKIRILTMSLKILTD